MADTRSPTFAPPHPLLVRHGFRIAQLYGASLSHRDPRITWKRYGVRGELRIEGLRALVRLYERYCRRPTTVLALKEELRIRVAREFARERVACGRQVAA